MALDSTGVSLDRALGGGVPAPASTTDGTGSPDAEKLRQLAQQFESLLVVQMLQEMRRTVAMDDSGQQGFGFGAGIMNDTMDGELGSALSKSGGFGLTAVLLRALSERLQAKPASGMPAAAAPVPSADGSQPAAPAAPAATAPAMPAEAGAPLKLDPSPRLGALGALGTLGTTTSAFGWRTDPMNGDTRFHPGVDLRAAYGQDVRAAAGGRVAFAGEQGGYGLTVVVEHDNGFQTRYAHLSTSAVAAGDTVAAGQLLARSGNSGRSTGPHLHFEVRQHGVPVDPGAWIKGSDAAAD